MKRTNILLVLCIIISVMILSGCSNKIYGNDGLIDKARQEINISNADTAEMQIIGSNRDGESILFWFMSGNEYQAHTYLPIEFIDLGNDQYEFVKTYKPIKRGMDIYALIWNNKYCFMINNESCKSLSLEIDNGNKELITVDTYPFLYMTDRPYATYNFEYYFLDENGDII